MSSCTFIPRSCLWLLLVCSSGHGSLAEEPPRLLLSWLSAQTNLQTWSADVTQIRSLKTLTQPLVAQGHLWFSAPNRFRWELVSPSQTIAVRQPTQLMVIYPKLKRAERYPLDGPGAGSWKGTLALLEAGFPRSQPDLEAQFRVLSQVVTGQVCEVRLQPRSPSVRRLMPELKVGFATNDFILRSTELHFADGSTLRNEFTNGRINPKLDEALFTPKLDADIQIVDPLKK